jgi:hypothetical protein
MESRGDRVGTALAAGGAGLSWMVLAALAYMGIGVGDHVPAAYGTQFLFWVPFSLSAATLAKLSAGAREAPGGRAGLLIGVAGGTLGAVGAVVMACVLFVQEALSAAALDCGPVGWVLLVLGTVGLDAGLLLFGVSRRGADPERRVARMKDVCLATGALGAAGVPVGQLGMWVGDEALGRALVAGCEVLFGAGWIILGAAILRGARG